MSTLSLFEGEQKHKVLCLAL